MRNFLHIITLWKLRREPRAMHQFAELYWRVLLTVTFTLIGAGLLSGGYLFFFGGNAANTDNLVQAGEETLTRDKIQAVVDLYEQRRLRFDAALKNGVAVPEPARTPEGKR